MKLFIRCLYVFLISLFLLSFTYFCSANFSNPKKSNVLNVFVWGDFFPEETIREFEAETGIKVNMNFYTSNEELILKLENTDGHGYDVVFPSDYGVTTLKEKNLLKPLDHSELDFFDTLEPHIVNQKFDPKNEFSIPYFWEVYGIAYEKNKIGSNFSPSLKSLFQGNHKVIMTGDPVEALDFAAHYLYGFKEALNSEEKKEVIKLLKAQKKNVEAYSDDRVQYMISSEDCPIAILRVSFFWKNYSELNHVEIYLPKEGVFTTIENVALSKNAKNIDAAYKFINFIYRPDIMAKQLDLCPLFPARKDALPYTNFAEAIPRYHAVFDEVSKRDDFYYTHYLLPQSEIRQAWVEIKN
jgi:spermidine/putrescine transport system substrate-binding protein